MRFSWKREFTPDYKQHRSNAALILLRPLQEGLTRWRNRFQIYKNVCTCILYFLYNIIHINIYTCKYIYPYWIYIIHRAFAKHQPHPNSAQLHCALYLWTGRMLTMYLYAASENNNNIYHDPSYGYASIVFRLLGIAIALMNENLQQNLHQQNSNAHVWFDQSILSITRTWHCYFADEQ